MQYPFSLVPFIFLKIGVVHSTRWHISIHLIKTAMSNRNSLLSQKLCPYLNEGRTLNDFRDLSKLKFILTYCSENIWILTAMVMTVWHL